MQYTKDIILDVRYKRKLDYEKVYSKMYKEICSKIKKWTSTIKRAVLKNKTIVIILLILASLMIIDLTLLTSFVGLLNMVY